MGQMSEKRSLWQSSLGWLRSLGARKELRLAYQIVSALLSLVSLVNLIPMTFVATNDPSYVLARIIDYILCGVFFIDFVVQLLLAPNRLAYFRTRGWLDLCSSIAWVDFLRITRIFRIFHFFRTLREMKGLIRTLLKNSALSVPLLICISTVVMLYITATMILQFESGVDGGINHPMDAIWWAVVTITTVGYGDLVPITYSGKMLGIAVMIFGVAFYGSVSGFLASWLVDIEDHQRDEEEMQHIQVIEKKLDHLEVKIDRILQLKGEKGKYDIG